MIKQYLQSNQHNKYLVIEQGENLVRLDVTNISLTRLNALRDALNFIKENCNDRS